MTATPATVDHEAHYAKCDSCGFFSSLCLAWKLDEEWEGKTTVTLCAECEVAAEEMGVRFVVG